MQKHLKDVHIPYNPSLQDQITVTQSEHKNPSYLAPACFVWEEDISKMTLKELQLKKESELERGPELKRGSELKEHHFEKEPEVKEKPQLKKEPQIKKVPPLKKNPQLKTLSQSVSGVDAAAVTCSVPTSVRLLTTMPEDAVESAGANVFIKSASLSGPSKPTMVATTWFAPAKIPSSLTNEQAMKSTSTKFITKQTKSKLPSNLVPKTIPGMAVYFDEEEKSYTSVLEHSSPRDDISEGNNKAKETYSKSVALKTSTKTVKKNTTKLTASKLSAESKGMSPNKKGKIAITASHSGEVVCPVPCCDEETFKTIKGYNRHWNDLHRKKHQMFTCPSCSMTSKQFPEVVKHIKKLHDKSLINKIKHTALSNDKLQDPDNYIWIDPYAKVENKMSTPEASRKVKEGSDSAVKTVDRGVTTRQDLSRQSRKKLIGQKAPESVNTKMKFVTSGASPKSDSTFTNTPKQSRTKDDNQKPFTVEKGRSDSKMQTTKVYEAELKCTSPGQDEERECGPNDSPGALVSLSETGVCDDIPLDLLFELNGSDSDPQLSDSSIIEKHCDVGERSKLPSKDHSYENISESDDSDSSRGNEQTLSAIKSSSRGKLSDSADNKKSKNSKNGSQKHYKDIKKMVKKKVVNAWNSNDKRCPAVGCSKRFFTDWSMFQHWSSVHMETLVDICSLCSYTTRTVRAMQYHWKIAHNVVNKTEISYITNSQPELNFIHPGPHNQLCQTECLCDAIQPQSEILDLTEVHEKEGLHTSSHSTQNDHTTGIHYFKDEMILSLVEKCCDPL